MEWQHRDRRLFTNGRQRYDVCGLVGPGHGRDKAVSAARHSLDAAAVLAALIQRAAQRRDLLRQIALLDRYSGPDPCHNVAFRDDRALMLGEQQEQIERARAERDRYGPSCPIQAEEAPPVKLKAIEEKLFDRFLAAHTPPP
ncbi:MAG: hypothetical protein WA633_18565 [Stellaceae bacterium]